MFDEELARRRDKKQRRAEPGSGAVEGGTPVAPDTPTETPAPARRRWPSSRPGIDRSIPAGDRDDEDDGWL
jgi:hypothetical protein